MLTPQKRQYLDEVFGKEEAAKWESDLTGASDAIKEMGVQYKDFSSTADNEPADEDGASDESYKALIGMAFEGHGETVRVVQAMSKAFDAREMAWKAEREKLETRLKALEKALASPASAASTSDSTVVEGSKADEAAAEIEKKQVETSEYDPMFPGMNVPVK